MKTKKNPKANLENYRKLFIQIALVLSLAIIYILLQQKTYQKEIITPQNTHITVDDTPQLVEYKIEKPKVRIKHTPKLPTIIKKVEDDATIKETILKDIDATAPMVTPVFIDTEDDNTEEEVDYSINTIQVVPVFPGCKGNNEQLKACLSKKIRQFVGEKFNTELAQTLGLKKGKQRIFTMFKIDENGKIIEIKAKAPHIRLEKEAVKIIKSLPKMTPGMQGGKKVKVKYSMPISFIIQ